MKELERCIIQWRKKKKLTQQDLAEMTGIHVSDIRKLESSIFVKLERDQLISLAENTEGDADLLLKIYYSEFKQELNAYKEKASDTASVAADQDETETNNGLPQNSPIIAELAEAVMPIMSMPVECRADLIRILKVFSKSLIIASGGEAVSFLPEATCSH